MYACLYRPPAPDAGPTHAAAPAAGVEAIARDYSPRYQRHTPDVVTIDVRGLERLFGSPRAMADQMRRDAASRGVRVHVALAGTQTAALILAHAHPGTTVVMPGDEAETLAPLPISALAAIDDHVSRFTARAATADDDTCRVILATVQRWGLRRLGE